jgi:hypothetical protein
MVDGAAASGYNSTVRMKMKASKVTKITIELDEREAMILAKILGNVGGVHEWRKFTGELYDSLLQCIDYEEFCEYTEGAIKQDMFLGD